MSSPPPAPPQFISPGSAVARPQESLWVPAFLFACFLGWLALSIVIVRTDLIEPPAQGVLFRLCLLATPFALGAIVFGIAQLFTRRDQIRAAEIQRADAMREPRK